MLPCIYTTQKTKKLKKWIDGFILPVRKGLRLYNEEKQFLYNSEFYKIIDDYIDTQNYLIYLDDINQLIAENTSAIKETIVTENHEITNIIGEKELDNDIDSSITYTNASNYYSDTDNKIENYEVKNTKTFEKVKGRSINSIKDLFKK